ncbi:type II secretion system F family protein [Aeromicrobium wangtongii]|uniref:type II secretion system F family protein n=1 Tax=Aeromicrobium wangtongii TaxID=2969247 RepID=UPI00201821DB|nr:type II secretion system protein [Aeromicrobium wangtongii]MCL3817390.1 type II secretion system protein [Aeromicrobium wangtongii]
MSVAAALLTATAVLLRWPSGGWRLRRRLGGRAQIPRGWAMLAATAIAASALPLLPAVSGPRVVLAATAAGVIWFGAGQLRRSRRRDRMARLRSESIELVGLMAAELRAGVLPQRMLTGLAGDFEVVAAAARAAELGGDVPAVLREAATEPGHDLLRDLAGAWQVADRSGAPLAMVLDRLEQSARIDREIAREIESGVAPARATGRLMAALPVLGLMLGSGMGGDPVGVLTSTWIGVLCLAAGCALACAGIAWIEHIAASAAQPP